MGTRSRQFIARGLQDVSLLQDDSDPEGVLHELQPSKQLSIQFPTHMGMFELFMMVVKVKANPVAVENG